MRLWPRGRAAPGPAPGSPGERPDGPTAGRQRAMGRGRTAPARRGTPPRAALAAWIGGHLAPTPGGQEDGQTAHQRAEQKAAWPDTWQRPGSSRAVRCASLGGSGHADGLVSGPGSGQSAERPDGPTVGHQRATGRMPGRGRAAPAQCVAAPWGGSGVAYVSRSDTISDPHSPSNPHTSADFGRLLAVRRVLIYRTRIHRTRRISHNKIR